MRGTRLEGLQPSRALPHGPCGVRIVGILEHLCDLSDAHCRVGTRNCADPLLCQRELELGLGQACAVGFSVAPGDTAPVLGAGNDKLVGGVGHPRVALRLPGLGRTEA